MKKPRPLLGTLLIVLALLLDFGRAAGVVGRLLSAVSLWAFGGPGTSVVVGALVVTGSLYWMPADAAQIMVRALRALRARRRPAPVLKSVPLVQPAAPVVPRGNLGDVHAALVSLGYRPSEFRGLLASMDAKKSVQALIREALAALQKEKTGRA